MCADQLKSCTLLKQVKWRLISELLTIHSHHGLKYLLRMVVSYTLKCILVFE